MATTPDPTTKRIKQLEDTVSKYEKVINLLLRRTQNLDIEVRRAKHENLRTNVRLSALEAAIRRGQQ